MTEAEKVKVLLELVKAADQDFIEKTSVEIRRTAHSSLADGLIGMSEALFKRFSLDKCFSGDTVDGKLIVEGFMVLREELVREKIKCIKFEASRDSLVKACRTGNMRTINSALEVLGHLSPPGDTTTH